MAPSSPCRRARVEADVTLGEGGRYRLMPVIRRQRFGLREAGTVHHLGEQRAGRMWHGGAGPKGVTEWPGYHAVGSLDVPDRLRAGATTVTARGLGQRRSQLDGWLVQPEIERLVLAGQRRATAVLRSFSTRTRHQRVDLPGDGPVVARSYDRRGRLVEVARGSEPLRVPIAPGGFTVVAR